MSLCHLCCICGSKQHFLMY